MERLLIALLALLPAVAVAQPWIEGAAPKVDSGQPTCFVYDRWVVTTAEDPSSDRSWIRLASRQSGPAEVPPCAIPPSIERKFGLYDAFVGMVGDVLLVRQAGSVNGGVLFLERVAGKRANLGVGYADSVGEPRVVNGAIELFVPLETGSAVCGAELFIQGIGRASCERRAREWVVCHERERGARLATASDPFARDAFTKAGAGTDCQVRLYEEAHVDLASLAVKPTGRLRGVVSFVATE